MIKTTRRTKVRVIWVDRLWGNIGHVTALAALTVEDVEHEEVLAQYNTCGYVDILIDILNDDKRVD